ncbi:MAG: hypothetical protein JXL97_05640 [Bacteroidales bacterium]|nr:hypothetical protein [Bacteroidales bacterium]
MIIYRDKLLPNKVYHAFNHAVGREYLFRNERNYYYFLEKYFEYISPIADTYAYCLMPNHYHFLIKLKTPDFKMSVEEMSDNCQTYKSGQTYNYSHHFKNFFRSYTGAYNKIYERNGSLFEPRFKRKIVDSKEYFINVLNYIHQNPVHHKFVDDKEDWKFSSFTNFYSGKNSKLNIEAVYKLFNNKTEFLDIHNLEEAEKFGLQMELSY